MFERSSSPDEPSTARLRLSRLGRLAAPARAAPAAVPEWPEPEWEEPEGRRPEGADGRGPGGGEPMGRGLAGAGGRIQQWLPGGGRHRAGRPRDVLRTAAAGPPRRWLAVVAVALAVAAVAVAAVLVGRTPDPERAPPLPAAHPGGSAPASAPGAGGRSATVVVSVVGQVRRPGLVSLRAGARVADALKAAGGAKRGVDVTTVNLARRVVDGEQIHVGVPAAAGSAPDGAGTGGAPPGKINLNSATAEQLEELPGIGEVTAQHILDWRAQHGGFTAVEQLREVDGIGERRLATLRERVTV